MKKIVYYINLFLIVSFLFSLSACNQPGNSGSFKEIDSEENTSSDFDPFAGTTWCGTLYEGEFTSPEKNGYGELLKFGTEKNNLIGKELGTVEFPNEIYSDNGKEFKIKIIENYLSEKNIKFIHGLPYNPISG